jgi:ribose 1,5-bisphosphokinase PhnN
MVVSLYTGNNIVIERGIKMKLLLVLGPCGSGKSTVAKFVESELGCARYGIDDYIREALGGYKKGFSPVLKIVGDKALQERFWSTGNYSWDGAVRILADRHDYLRDSLTLTDEERYAVGSGILGRFISEMNGALQKRNVVQEAGPGARQAFERADADKYVLKLLADPEIVIPRLMTSRGWDQETAEQRFARTSHGYDPPVGTVWQMPNNTPEELETIKNYLREAFGGHL